MPTADHEGLDIAANRAARKWTRRELAGRVLWRLAYPLFRLSPRVFWPWRVWLLRAFGADIGSHVRIFPTVRIMIPWNLKIGEMATIGDRVILYALGPITIKNAATISQGAHLCAGTHNHRKADFELIKSPITIGSQAWICADAFVGPNVTIGDGAVLGARAVAMRDISPWTIASGNPARHTGTRVISTP